MSASKRDLDRLYWSLVVFGPMTLYDIQKWTNWTRSRSNDALHRLKVSGCVELTERGQHRTGFANQMRCGKWKAITETPYIVVDAIVVDAEVA